MVVLQNAPNLAPTSAKKRKATVGDDEPSGAFTDCTAKLFELKESLSCQKHDRRFCYISPLTSEHVQVGDNDLSLWARKMVRTFVRYNT